MQFEILQSIMSIVSQSSQEHFTNLLKQPQMEPWNHVLFFNWQTIGPSVVDRPLKTSPNPPPLQKEDKNKHAKRQIDIPVYPERLWGTEKTVPG